MRILLVLLLIAATAGFALTGSMRFLLFQGFLILIVLIRTAEKKKRADDPAQTAQTNQNPLKRRVSPWGVIGAVLLLILFLPAPLALRSTFVWRYPFQRAYLGLYRNIGVPDWFPEFREDIVSDYHMDYVASVMQGTGHFSVCFMTSPERAAELEAQFAEQAIYTDSLPDAGANASFCKLRVPEEQYQAFSAVSEDEWDGNTTIYADRDFFFHGGNAADAAVYILDAKCSMNHPASSAVIISSKTGAVQFSQFGYTHLAYGE